MGKSNRKGILMDEKLVEKIVEKIIEDLSDRKCLKCEWEQFDDDLKREVRDRCKEIILKIGSKP
jgi:hypothetical protein